MVLKHNHAMTECLIASVSDTFQTWAPRPFLSSAHFHCSCRLIIRSLSSPPFPLSSYLTASHFPLCQASRPARFHLSFPCRLPSGTQVRPVWLQNWAHVRGGRGSEIERFDQLLKSMSKCPWARPWTLNGSRRLCHGSAGICMRMWEWEECPHVVYRALNSRNAPYKCKLNYHLPPEGRRQQTKPSLAENPQQNTENTNQSLLFFRLQIPDMSHNPTRDLIYISLFVCFTSESK